MKGCAGVIRISKLSFMTRDRQADPETDKQTQRQTVRHTHRKRQTDRQKENATDRQQTVCTKISTLCETQADNTMQYIGGMWLENEWHAGKLTMQAQGIAAALPQRLEQLKLL